MLFRYPGQKNIPLKRFDFDYHFDRQSMIVFASA